MGELLSFHTRLAIIVFVSVVFLLAPLSSTQATDPVPQQWMQAVTSTEEKQQIKTQLNRDLREQLHIEPYTVVADSDEQIDIERNTKETYIVHSRGVVGFDEMPGIFENEKQDKIDFRGTSYPFTGAVLTFKTTDQRQHSTANSDGVWTVTLPVDSLSKGEHTAYMQLESRHVFSDVTPVAQFVVIADTQLSNTTWMFILGAGGTLVLLSLVLVYEFSIWTREVM